MMPRSTFLHGSAALAGLGAITTTVAACGGEETTADAAGADTGGDTDGDTASPFGPVPDDACPRIERMPAITGPGVTDRFRMAATDLGAPAVAPDGRILFVFGDTFEEPVVGGGFWRSPVGLFADPDRPLDDGISWTSAVGGETAEQLVDYEHDADDADPVSTILPGDVLTMGDTMYLWMMVNHGFGTVASTEIWTSADSGETWERTAEMFPGDHADGLMQQCTWCAHPEDGYVYLLTTGFQRDQGVILSRVDAGSILDPEAYETFSGDGTWGGEGVTVLGGAIGEMCLRVVEEQWVLTYFDAGNYRVDILAADSPTAIEDATPSTLLHGGDWGEEAHDVVAQLYGPFIVPGSTLEVMHLVCSQWRTGPDWPYHVEQFRIEDPLGRRCGEG